MTITNGYCTLEEAREALLTQRRYTAATLSFDAASKTISDAAYGLKRFASGALVRVSGSELNDGYYTVATGDTAGSLVVTEDLVDEDAGESVTIAQVDDLVDDAILEAAIEAVSRGIDTHCSRRFYQAEETRYYSPEWSDLLVIDDLVSITALATDDVADRTYATDWAETDYELEPANAVTDNWPYTRIRITPNGDHSFPVMARAVKVTGTFGWPAIPAPVGEACRLQVARLFHRKDAPFGIVGSMGVGQLQVIPRLDPDVTWLLTGYERMSVGGV